MRISVVGSERRAEVALPTSEPLGSALPELIALLDEPSKPLEAPLILLTPAGEQVDLSKNPGEQNLVDGTVLSLVRSDVTAAPPVVIDLTQASANAHDAHSAKWNEKSRALTGAVAFGIASALSGHFLPIESPNTKLLTVLGVLLTALIIGVICRAFHWNSGRTLSIGAAVGLALPAAITAAAIWQEPSSFVIFAATFLLALSGIAAFTGLAIKRNNAAVLGGSIGAFLSGLLLLLTSAALGVAQASAAGIVATAGIFVLGMLPWAAIGSAGLTGLDDAAAAGKPVSKMQSDTVIAQAYQSLTWGIVGSCLNIALAAILLAFETDVWSLWILVALLVAVTLRTRTFPLQIHGFQLWALVAVAALSLIFRLSNDEPLWDLSLLLLIAIAFAGLLTLLKLPDHSRARLRRWGDILETIAIIALVPLIVGSFGIYGQLLATFGDK